MQDIFSNRLVLRPFGTHNITVSYLKWMNDTDVNQFLESRFTDHTFESLREYYDLAIKSGSFAWFAIYLAQSNRHIGNIKIGPINKYHNVSSIGLLIGEKDCWGKGYASESILTATNWAFESLDLFKITAGIYRNNIGSLKAFQKAGFHVESVSKLEALFCNSRVDVISLAKFSSG